MSGVIWGIINLKEKEVSDELGKSMLENMTHCKVDKYNFYKKNNVFFGCGLQYITSESLNEILPYHDVENELIITCDAIIDNRNELLEKLQLNKNEVNDFTDTEYILMAYKKWGQDCCNYLLGDFSFVIYDEKEKEIFCARDQIGRRTLYYYCNEDIFSFCTLSEPLIKVLGDKPKLNERWITDFLALTGGLHVCEDEETVYQDIKQVQAAHNLIVGLNKFEKREYWNPIGLKELKLNTDKEYIDEFMKIYTEAINCRLRGLGDMGLFVSGGLDSSSIAAISSKLLKKQRRKLKTFTSVPIDEFIDYKEQYYINDEGDYVKQLSESLGNIEVNLFNAEGKNAVNVIDESINIFEQPYKIIENSHWQNSMAEFAAKNNCKVVMKGQYGNVTISYGDFFTHAKTLFRQCKIIELFKEINNACEMHKIPRRKFTKAVFKTFLPYSIRKKKFIDNHSDYDRFENSPINEELINKYCVNDRFDKLGLNMPVSKVKDLKEAKKSMTNNYVNSHVFCISTKISLENGIIFRDPTADIRIIEFCLKLPTEQFVKGGIDRRLIRNAMEGLLPENIRMNIKYRGVQGADCIQRLQPIWKNVYKEMEEAVNNENIEKYINVNKLKKKLIKMQDGISEDNIVEVRTLMETLIFSKFINRYNEQFS